ncbi:C-type lectin domain family 17, member A-like [Gambusia affinis]|uniref:C-type lectin domain family 17, member A-like n=1 Tax=Gambusia affinis TaxID=33528 RepID=UPI001CDD3271|nr:C-type lectin domain family 17, member A-like [Gambusia affinis]
MSAEINTKKVQENAKTPGSDSKEEVCSSFCLLLALGVTLVLLAVSIGIITWSCLEVKKQKERASRLELASERTCREKEKLNQKLRFFLTSTNFSVRNFCPVGECQLCPDGWFRFQEKCYWFRNDTELNWEESRRFCQNRSADLVVINNPQQQAFISNLSSSFYWLGLQHVDGSWVWIDGCKDTLGFWMDDVNPLGSFAEVLAWRNLTDSWLPTTSSTFSKVVCEQQAFNVSI